MDRNDLLPITLNSRYTVESGPVYLTGVQAMLRVLIDQTRSDRAAGLNTAALVSGYPGSPLGGVDTEIMRHAPIFEAEQVFHQLGLNEELAATAIYGTQMLHQVPKPKYDGVLGMWFGKSPGVDRAADAFHHANFHGTGRNGGVLAVAGDDPHARSTILPSDSNTIFSSFYMPVLAPGNVQEVLDYGRHGYALSRAAGLWVGFKLISDIADSSATALVGLDRVAPVVPEVVYDGQPFKPAFHSNEAGPPMLEREREIYYGRLEIARRYARLNGLNRIVGARAGARRGILTGGKTYYDLREALKLLGIDDEALDARGIRILKMGLLYPFDRETALEFADGLADILVVEDKRPFLELFLKDVLYGRQSMPGISGRNDTDGRLLLTACGELSVDIIKTAVARWLGLEVSQPAAPAANLPLSTTRTPYFCSGCPHNRSLRVPEGSVVGAGIGCHIMTLWMGKVMGEATGYTQMGGEGAQWVGLQRFTGTNHFFQNLGDGTYAHSGSLAIRFAVAASANVTYKLLYNSAVAMTGGQDVFAGKTVAGIVDQLAAEGVQRIVITTDEPERYRGKTLPALASVRHRDELLEVERELAAENGVTVLINDQQCAAEKRRLRKRGALEKKPLKVYINERICEGCGDCGVKSNCLSVEPVVTEFGRKTRINQTSCNSDYSCLLGDCPSFMTVEGGMNEDRVDSVGTPSVTLPDSDCRLSDDGFSMLMAGIGGTGVVTVNQILGMAAALAGLHVRSIDQIGSSQKAGPVVSMLHVDRQPLDGAVRIAAGTADTYLAFDLLTAADPVHLAVASSDRTVFVGNTDAVPTGGTVTEVGLHYPEKEVLVSRIRANVREVAFAIDGLHAARRLFGNEVAANMMMIGAAYQAGALPIPAVAIEAAIEMNGVAVQTNIDAFRWGRYAVIDRVGFDAAVNRRDGPPITWPEIPGAFIARIGAIAPDEGLAERISIRAGELIAYQDSGYADDYLRFLEDVAGRSAGMDRHAAFIEAVALNLYKVMAYKDEYEVARLFVEAYDRDRHSGRLGSGQSFGWWLHPTFLRKIGVNRKVRMSRWFIPVARLLAKAKRLRGGPLDLFGIGIIRSREKALISDYRATVLRALENGGQPSLLIDIANLPDVVRGYEDVKLRNIETYNERKAQLMSQATGSKRVSDPVDKMVSHLH
ncbi:indolepyruvate ferredoxin oxidoreductase family protein [Sphingosinicella microcystinivorans]|uniref:indolepyruvate ferredoxin oxidoreductase family protein n=1 Tax=Sphingosinicella microcystinivorans TaxID=335406 RepID=UPI0022F3AD05|nr:indolepyruvate ferredoxin oxidoreductase family protein [Sphingosinicella microcystinivorans]WBX86200.1 indolepyruvate ferredoxin oxidoreductase family protein [Sphingosinicella microcystinivorans]